MLHFSPLQRSHRSPKESSACGSGSSLVLWPWFVVGFLFVFIGMSFTVTMYSMHPSGEYVTEYSLWEYYWIEIPRGFGPQSLGPATGSSSAARRTAFEHLLLSAGGGAVCLGIGWLLRRIKRN